MLLRLPRTPHVENAAQLPLRWTKARGGYSSHGSWLPDGVDPCGENGEFHTFVQDGPLFRAPIPCRTGEIVNRDGFVYCDVVPE